MVTAATSLGVPPTVGAVGPIDFTTGQWITIGIFVLGGVLIPLGIALRWRARKRTGALRIIANEIDNNEPYLKKIKKSPDRYQEWLKNLHADRWAGRESDLSTMMWGEDFKTFQNYYDALRPLLDLKNELSEPQAAKAASSKSSVLASTNAALNSGPEALHVVGKWTRGSRGLFGFPYW